MALKQKTIKVTILIPKTPDTPLLPIDSLPLRLPPKNDSKTSKTNSKSNLTVNVSNTSLALPKTGDSTNQSIPFLFGVIALSSAILLLRQK